MTGEEEANVDDTGVDVESEYERSEDEIVDDYGVSTIGERWKRKKLHELSEYNPNSDHKSMEWKKGMCFETPKQMQEAVQFYAIANGYNVLWKRSTEERQEAVCVKGCPWGVRGSWMKKENTFVVRFVSNEHKCSRSLCNRQATTSWLVKQIMEGVIRRTGCTARDIQQQVMEKHHLEVPLMKVCKACWLSEKLLNGTIEDHFKDLRPYLNALRLKYPRSTFELVYDLTLSIGLYTTFKRLFICSDALRSGFIQGCRRFIGFDGTFLKHRCGGILLSAVGRDWNDGMYPIALVIVEGENTDSWAWFLGLLFRVLEVGSGQGWTFISDQQKVSHITFVSDFSFAYDLSIIYLTLHAIENLAPAAEHRNCARHIYQNWKVKHKELFLKSCYYKIVKSTNEQEYAIALKEMREGMDGLPGSIEVVEDFLKQGSKHFCKAYFSTSSKCGTVTNNMCETFNSYIVAARRLPLIDILERIRRLLIVRKCEKKRTGDRCHDALCPNVRKELELTKENTGRYVVKPFLAQKFEVSLNYNEKDRYLVDFNSHSCSCRYWNLHAIPCTHAIACINFMKRDVEDYVDDCFKIQPFKLAYGHVLEPIEGVKFWPRDDLEPIRPPPYKKLPGRPKKHNRRVSKEKDLLNLGFVDES